MSIFGKIKDAIFGRKTAERAHGRRAPHGRRASRRHDHRNGHRAGPDDPADRRKSMSRQVLIEIADSKGNPDLNYKTSIVDLMKLLGLDSSLDNRKELATELGYTGATDGSAEMNIWLHKAVMRELAKNGGKVPASMTD